jgi:hypothetical protein
MVHTFRVVVFSQFVHLFTALNEVIIDTQKDQLNKRKDVMVWFLFETLSRKD